MTKRRTPIRPARRRRPIRPSAVGESPAGQLPELNSALLSRAVESGRQQAADILRRPARRRAARRAVDNGIVVAEGDSWFDYPFHDVLERLEDEFGFRVESVAKAGDLIEEMAYNPAEGTALLRTLTRLADDGKTPRAILLSGGGNDLVGDGFGTLINHVSSGLPALNTSIAAGIINERLLYAYGYLIGRINQMTQALFPNPVPIVIHGYGYAVPDGRGFLGGVWFLPGPWLRPGFDRKGHTSLPANTAVIESLIDQFNDMLQSIQAPAIPNVNYLDLRPVLRNTLAGEQYKDDWDNELHPTTDGFEAVAKTFRDLLLTFPKP